MERRIFDKRERLSILKLKDRHFRIFFILSKEYLMNMGKIFYLRYFFSSKGWNILTAVMRSVEKLYFGMRSSENGFLDAPNLRLALGEKMVGTRCTRKEDVDWYIFRREVVE